MALERAGWSMVHFGSPLPCSALDVVCKNNNRNLTGIRTAAQAERLRGKHCCPQGRYTSKTGSRYVHLPNVMSDEELQQEIDEVYEAFLTGSIHVPGKDLCDMSGNQKGRTPQQFTLYNVMLPRIYHPALQGNMYERRCKDIADQLQGGNMHVDYDQILAKRPHSEDAVFAWHQDMAYWPPFASDISAATCWLAVTDSTEENGCMRFLPGSHKEAQLRKHAPVGANREDSHALYLTLQPNDNVMTVPIKRGDITVHDEHVAHGSGPNRSAGWRKAYVVAFRKAECIAEERSRGFTHSHNDEYSWDVFAEHSK